MPYDGGEVKVPNVSLHQLLWDNFQKYGDETAIIDASRDGKSITYREMYECSRKCAAYLQSQGIKKGDFVAICASGRLEFVYLMIGILGAGAVVAPCNPSYTKNEIVQQFSITQPRAVFVEEEMVETMKSARMELTSVDKIFVIGRSSEFVTVDQLLTAANSESLKEVDIDPENDIAFAPHSSGTTGLPKCIAMSHKSYVLAVCREFFMRREPSLVIYLDRPMYHAGGFGILIMTVNNCAKTVIERRTDVDQMFQNIEKYKISCVFSVPSTLIELVNSTNNEKYDLSSLRKILSGGAAQAIDVIKRVKSKYNVSFMAGYGMTEISAAAAIDISDGDSATSGGKILPGVQIKITNTATEEECPPGMDGEIRVRSAQVTKGYIKNPEANANAFDADGWFRTGDLGHHDADGHLFIVDRLKEIIKYKAVQVSPAELESVIIRHPKVADVAVIGIPDEKCGELPKAFVVPDDPSLTVGDIHQIVEENLVDYKHLRGGVEFVNAIPKSPTGKIQRNVLKNMAEGS